MHEINWYVLELALDLFQQKQEQSAQRAGSKKRILLYLSLRGRLMWSTTTERELF